MSVREFLCHGRNDTEKHGVAMKAIRRENGNVSQVSHNKTNNDNHHHRSNIGNNIICNKTAITTIAPLFTYPLASLLCRAPLALFDESDCGSNGFATATAAIAAKRPETLTNWSDGWRAMHHVALVTSDRE